MRRNAAAAVLSNDMMMFSVRWWWGIWGCVRVVVGIEKVCL